MKARKSEYLATRDPYLFYSRLIWLGRWKARYVYEIPVLMHNDQIKAKGRWGESEVLKALEELRQEKS